jgi:hypothetical protein
VSDLLFEEVVTIRVTARCPQCRKEITWKRKLDAEIVS